MSNDEEPDGYVYSKDGEEFEGELFETRDDARIEALAEYQDEIDDGSIESVYTAKAHKLSASYFAPDGGALIEIMRDHVHDNVSPEIAEGWPAVGGSDGKAIVEDLSRRIASAVDKWADEHDMQPTFFSVSKVRGHAIDGSDHDDEE